MIMWVGIIGIVKEAIQKVDIFRYLWIILEKDGEAYLNVWIFSKKYRWQYLELITANKKCKATIY